LQAESAAVQTQIIKTNQLEYENLSAIYLWWRAAVAVPGYLEEAYKPTLVRRVFGEHSGELSFRRLLYLMYGIYGLDKDNLDRKNRALLRLHVEYERHHELYAKDAVTKLAGFINSQGGINSLIGGSNREPSVKPNDGSSGVIDASRSRAGATPLAGSTDASKKSALSSADVLLDQSTPSSKSTYQPRVTFNVSDAMRYAAFSEDGDVVISIVTNRRIVSVTIGGSDTAYSHLTQRLVMAGLG
jgi:hypothetical protein